MINIAVVGYGGMGAYHCKCIKENCADIINVTGCYDIDPKRMQVAKKDGYATYSNFEQIADDKLVDAVLLAMPNDFHLPYTLECAKAGKSVLCEKPAALSSDEFEQMMKVTEQNKVKLIIHQNRRWDADYLTVKKIYLQKPIGDVYRIESRVMGSNGIPGDWRKIKKQGGGMVLDWGVHLIDQALDMIEGDIVSVYCNLSYVFAHEVDDGCVIELKFADGTQYLVVVDTNCFVPLARWQIYGYNGTAVIKNWDIEGYMIAVKERVDKNLKGIKAGNGYTKTMADRSSSSIEELALPIVAYNPRGFYENFAATLKGQEEQIVKNEQVLRVFRVMEAAFESYEKKQIINRII